jgi:hypothetical protein
VKNPLEQFVGVEDRGDGTYAKVTRTDRDTLNLDTILRTMANSIVMNFNAGQFKDVFTRARGVFEKIGPVFEYYDEELDNYLSVNVTAQKASAKLPESLVIKGKRPNDRQMLFFLKRKGIVNGIDMRAIAQLLNGSAYDKYIDIAFATPPINGSDAQTQLLVPISPGIKPEIKSDGSVDYRSIQTFTPVTKGELLITKIPPGTGRPGISVTGDPIPAHPGKDIKLMGGKNTEISADGMQLRSSATGIIFYENTLLSIVELLHIGGDVDFSVGNIKYTGDILISGSVKPGFVVETDGSIQIKGSVESAKIISRLGSVIIDNGIMGKGDTFITAKNGITISFAQDTQLSTMGKIILEKYLLHCKVTCNSFEGSGPQSCIIGGEIKASTSIIIRTCGSDKDVPTKIIVYDRNKSLIVEKCKELNDLRDKLTTDMQPVEKQLRTKAALLKKVGDGASDRQRDEIKKWIDAYNAIKKKITYVESKITELSQINTETSDQSGFIYISDKCYPGTEIVLYDVSLPIKSILTGKRFLMRNKSVIIEG